MAAPPKPWEMAGVNSQNASSMGAGDVPPCCRPQSRPVPPGMSADVGGLPQTLSPAPPPPLPDRPMMQNSGLSSGYGYGGGLSSGYGGGLSSGYGGGLSSGYGGYGGYGGGMYSSGLGYGGGMGGMYGGGMYGGYGGGMYGGGYRMSTEYHPNGFVQQAEESSRQAFESIGSVVQVFGSVSMMLESTFQAVYSSFRAVIGVADQFGRMKAHLAQIFSALAVIRGLKWLAKKVLVLLQLRAAGLPEDAWTQAAAQEGANILLSEGGKGKSSWPIMMFFAIVFGGPWVIWKLLSSFSGNKPQRWQDGSSDHFLAVGEYEFAGQGEQELSFRKGQQIIIAPKELQPRMRDWLLASVDGQKEGIIPANYVKVMGKRKGRQQPTAPAAAQAKQLQPSLGQPLNIPDQNPELQEMDNLWPAPSMDNVQNNVSNELASDSNSSTRSASDILDTMERDKTKKCGHCKD